MDLIFIPKIDPKANPTPPEIPLEEYEEFEEEKV